MRTKWRFVSSINRIIACFLLIISIFLLIFVSFSCKKDINKPVAVFSVDPESGDVNTLFSFNASASYQGEGLGVTIREYFWDFNSDGVWDTICIDNSVVYHRFSTPGNKTVSMMIRNSQGYNSTAIRTFIVTEYINNSPIKPSNPNPSNNASGQITQLTLSWSCTDPDNDPVTYKVYFGDTIVPPLVESELTEKTYNPGVLDAGQTYYWKIIATDNHNNSNSSELWHFRTQGSVQQCPSSLVDSRDGSTYATVVIGQQCWMAENLNIGDMITSTSSNSNQTNNDVIEKYCYGNSQANCNTLGGLYQWDEMMGYSTEEGSSGICPEGWHIPTEKEWNTLVDFLGGNLYAGNFLKANGSSNFNALLGGSRILNGSFSNKDSYGYFWSSSPKDGNYSFQIHLVNGFDAVFYTYDNKSFGKSVRCIKD